MHTCKYLTLIVIFYTICLKATSHKVPNGYNTENGTEQEILFANEIKKDKHEDNFSSQSNHNNPSYKTYAKTNLSVPLNSLLFAKNENFRNGKEHPEKRWRELLLITTNTKDINPSSRYPVRRTLSISNGKNNETRKFVNHSYIANKLYANQNNSFSRKNSNSQRIDQNSLQILMNLNRNITDNTRVGRSETFQNKPDIYIKDDNTHKGRTPSSPTFEVRNVTTSGNMNLTTSGNMNLTTSGNMNLNSNSGELIIPIVMKLSQETIYPSEYNLDQIHIPDFEIINMKVNGNIEQKQEVFTAQIADIANANINTAITSDPLPIYNDDKTITSNKCFEEISLPNVDNKEFSVSTDNTKEEDLRDSHKIEEYTKFLTNSDTNVYNIHNKSLTLPFVQSEDNIHAILYTEQSQFPNFQVISNEKLSTNVDLVKEYSYPQTNNEFTSLSNHPQDQINGNLTSKSSDSSEATLAEYDKVTGLESQINFFKSLLGNDNSQRNIRENENEVKNDESYQVDFSDDILTYPTKLKVIEGSSDDFTLFNTERNNPTGFMEHMPAISQGNFDNFENILSYVNEESLLNEKNNNHIISQQNLYETLGENNLPVSSLNADTNEPYEISYIQTIQNPNISGNTNAKSPIYLENVNYSNDFVSDINNYNQPSSILYSESGQSKLISDNADNVKDILTDYTYIDDTFIENYNPSKDYQNQMGTYNNEGDSPYINKMLNENDQRDNDRDIIFEEDITDRAQSQLIASVKTINPNLQVYHPAQNGENIEEIIDSEISKKYSNPLQINTDIESQEVLEEILHTYGIPNVDIILKADNIPEIILSNENFLMSKESIMITTSRGDKIIIRNEDDDEDINTNYEKGITVGENDNLVENANEKTLPQTQEVNMSSEETPSITDNHEIESEHQRSSEIYSRVPQWWESTNSGFVPSGVDVSEGFIFKVNEDESK